MSENKKGLDKKKLGLGILAGVVVLGLGGFLVSKLGGSDSNEPSKRDVTVISEYDNLEDYIVGTYSDQDYVEDFSYMSHSTSGDELFFTDFSDEDVFVPEYEQGRYAGTVEFNESSSFYAIDVDVEGVEFPITDSVTKRVLIPTPDSEDYSEDVIDIFYNENDELDVQTSYFAGDIDYALIQVLVPDLQIYTHVRYVQPDTYEYILAEEFTKESEADGYIVSREYYEIGGQLYLRYEIVDYSSNEDAVPEVDSEVIEEEPNPEDESDVDGGAEDLEEVVFHELRGMENIKEAEVQIDGMKLKVAVASGLGNARKLLERVKEGEHFDVIEIMACPGGCIDGGGQPFIHGDVSIIEKRMKGIHSVDGNKAIRYSYKNKSIKKLYDEFLGEPYGIKAKELLHTEFIPRKKHY